MSHLQNHHNHRHLSTNETRALVAVVLSLLTMSAELYYGMESHSVSLEMGGWHLLSHVFVLALAWFAYKLVDWKVFTGIHEHQILSGAGFISALSLSFVTIWMFAEGVQKLISPEINVTDAALITAGIGVVVNGIAAYLLHQGHDSDTADMNIYAAYLHVLSDVVLGAFSIVALLSARYFGWYKMDGICGILTSVVVLRWVFRLLFKSWKDMRDLE